MKQCSKCRGWKPLDDFDKNRSRKDGLHGWCKLCKREYRQSETGKIVQKKYRQSLRGKVARQRYYQSEHGKAICKAIYQKYHSTLNGYLRQLYQSIKQRCTNPKNDSYKYYGERGLRCLFTSNEFVDYVKNDMGIIDISRIKGLTIDRIDNDKHYEKGNIRFITRAENNRNKGKWSKWVKESRREEKNG